MTKFSERIFKFEKKEQSENGKQGDMTKYPEPQEKQTEQDSNNPEKKVEGNITGRLKEIIKLNETVHTMERCVGKFNNTVRAGILAAAMTAGGAAVSEGVESQPEQERGYTHEEYIKKNEQRSTAVLSRFFKDAPRVLKACGGVTDFQKNSEDENAPVLMHIAQNHGLPDYRDAGTYISQQYVRNCVISMIEENNTGKVLPIGFEHMTERADREERLKELMLYYIDRSRSSQRDKYMFFDGNNASQEKLNEFPYKLNPENLSTLSNPLSSIIEHFKPEELMDILWLLGTKYEQISDNEINDILLSGLMELLYEIEKEHNVHFEITDTNPSVSYPNNQIDNYLSSPNNQNFSKMNSAVMEFYDNAIIKRDKFAVETSLQLAEKFDTALAVCIFGSSHDFYDNIAGKNANLLRIETAPSNVYNGIPTYEITDGHLLDAFYSDYGIPLSSEIVQSWNFGGGNREVVRNFLLHTRQHQYTFIFRNVHAIQSALQFSHDEWFSIIRDSIQDRKHLWAHGIYGDIEKFRNYVSAEQFASLKEEVLKCKGHENEKR